MLSVSVLEYLVILVASQVILFDYSVAALGGAEIEAHKRLFIRRIFNSSGIIMADPDTDDIMSDILTDSDLDGDSPLSMGSSRTDGNDYHIFYLTPRINTTSSNVPHSASSEFTQMVSIMAFFTIVMLAIGAWLLSKHCCFRDKHLRRRNANSVAVSTARPPSASQQFNFLGVQVPRRLNNNGSTIVTMDKPDDLPPSYSDLFPEVIVTENPPIDKDTVVTIATSSDHHHAGSSISDTKATC